MDNERASTAPPGGRAEDAKRQAQSAARQLKDRGLERAESAKSAAADQAEALAGAVDKAADELRGSNPTLAEYASNLSRGISAAAEQISNRSIEDLLGDARALAQRNPTVFVLGSVGLGVVLSRFLKASASRTNQWTSRSNQTNDQWTGRRNRASDQWTTGSNQTGELGR